MVAGAVAGNISAEATTPTGNTFAEAMRGACSQTSGLCPMRSPATVSYWAMRYHADQTK
jgi:hypothetical protein